MALVAGSLRLSVPPFYSRWAGDFWTKTKATINLPLTKLTTRCSGSDKLTEYNWILEPKWICDYKMIISRRCFHLFVFASKPFPRASSENICTMFDRDLHNGYQTANSSNSGCINYPKYLWRLVCSFLSQPHISFRTVQFCFWLVFSFCNASFNML